MPIPTDPLPPVAPVFPMLVGCWRSGTTLLRSVFDSHPDIAVPDETNLLPHVLNRFDGHPFDLETYLYVMRTTDRYQYWGVPDDLLDAAIAVDPPASLADAVRLTYRAYAWHVGKRGYADKTPGHLRDMDRIAALLPEARFVHLIRDGHDVAIALRAVNFGPSSIDEAALYWRNRVTSGRALGLALGPERYREFRYEALVADPAGTIRDVCAFLDVAFTDEMLDHERSAHALVAQAWNPGVHGSVAEPIRTGVRDWRREMSAAEVARFELVAGGLLDELGYERGAPAPSLLRRVDARARVARLELLRAYRRARGLGSAHWW